MATIIVNGRSVEAMVTVGCDAAGNGGVGLPEPSTYDGMTATVVDTTTNAKGQIIGAVICDDVGKASMTWNYLTVKQWSDMCKLFSTTQGGAFIQYCKFFDQTTGQYAVREMYPSDRKAKSHLRDASGNVTGWRDCSFNLIDTRRRGF